MKIAIMQPYIFPYIGYFQLMNAVDMFVIYDDVQYIKRGWINRNRILNQGKEYMFSIPLTKASREALISERIINADEWRREKRKLMSLLKRNYCKAPFFDSTISLISDCLELTESLLVDFIEKALTACCNRMDIDTQMVRASKLDIERKLKGEERIIAICQKLGATHYINPIGGKELYNHKAFAAKDIELSFIQSHNICYQQFNNEFIPCLSIIDVLMFSSLARIQEYLKQYDLV